MTKEEIAIKAIRIKIELIDSLNNSNQFKNWQKTVSSTLTNIYTYRKDVVDNFESIKSTKVVYSGSGDRTYEAKAEAKEFLESIIVDIEHFGLVELIEKNSKDTLSVNVNQHNEQNQSTLVSINLEYIIEVFKGELRTSEIDELKEILEANIDPKIKKKNFIEKIKSFGSDVASNILANILTNPKVYEGINGML